MRDLKSFSRADEEKVTAIDLRRSLDTSLTLVWNEIKHRARLVKDYDGLPSVRGNEARLGQVFINLLVNAAQAMPEGAIDRNELRVVGRTDAMGNAVVEIHDTGCGIPADNLDRIFESFFTTKPIGEGTGLGLAICHGIIASMGGSLAVHSEVGRGSVFRVALPVAKVETVAARPVSHAPSRTGPRGRILVIDRFDLILCDMMMPQMTGMEFYSRLTALRPAQAERVVFMTGGAFTARAREFLARLPNLRIEKPFDIDHILAMVGAHLRGAAPLDVEAPRQAAQ